ncbi:phosphatidate cytidylyltransferase [Culicoidibacter larvae]|uniref:Phosphatidate cytidylyltransferase n=1 Tax=Culicoidibacter larvae TaxID=2579976 RepID=A0A5R8QET8_9FIRM|nr:phosphatidate cytidylyltransferase [Culicoidibacter larvae]TLG76508.1 hypothetical protein FEZ08_02525 [Culicoidibacter larvae]
MKLLNKSFLQRLLTGICLTIGFLLITFAGGPLLFIGAFSIVMLIAFYETKLVSKNKFKMNIFGFIILAVAILLLGWTQYSIYNLIPFVLLLIMLYLILIPIFDQNIHIDSVVYFFTMTLYVGIAFFALVYLYLRSPLNILFLAAVAFGSDVGGYLLGSLIGKHKMAPTISPKKSWEGSIGGLIFALISVFVIAPVPYELIMGATYIQPFNNPIVLVVSIVFLTAISQLGDLFTSVIKRYFGVKDFGTIFPGHGGILDRFDSFIAVAIFMMIFTMIATQLGLF